jgi:UDP-2,3-diacylglucosamine pyrophosphatase LpxH
VTNSPREVRAIFVSDVHLGTRNCQAERLLEFLRGYESAYLYLVGDIVDFWAMKRGIHWSAAQNTVVQKILERARHGVRVTYVPGNHDESLREHLGSVFGGIRLERAPVHHAHDGRRLLLEHGDDFDQVTRYHRWVGALGDHGYALLMSLNASLSAARRRLGLAGHWSLSSYVKANLDSARAYIAEYEQAVARHAAQHGFDGVVCGHIHAPAYKTLEGIAYLNCGDWVDSCTALVEHLDGRFELLGTSVPHRIAAPARESLSPAFPAPLRNRGQRPATANAARVSR